MSTLRVSTIQDTAGSNSSTPAAIANGIAKAWVNFNGTGTVAIRAQYNVSSITDLGTGSYELNFTSVLSDANYSTVATTNTLGRLATNANANNTTAKADVRTTNLTPAYADVDGIFVAIFR